MNLPQFLFAVSCILFCLPGYGQEMASTKEEIQKSYNKNIRKSRIDGVYIPKDIEEAIHEIIQLSPPESLDKFKNAKEEFVVKRLHFGLGKWIATKWNFLEGSRYSHYLRMMGIADPDDMIQVTLTSLHRKLNESAIDLESQATIIKQRNKENQEKRQGEREVIEQFTQPIDTTGGGN